MRRQRRFLSVPATPVAGGPVLADPTVGLFDGGSILYATAGGRATENNANLYTPDGASIITGPRGTGTYTGRYVAVETGNAAQRGYVSSQASADTASARFVGRKSRGTPSAPATVVTGDILVNHVALGHDGTNYLEMGSVAFVAEGTIAATRVPTRVVISTGTDALPSVLTEAARWDSAQQTGLGGTPLATGGRLQVFETSANAVRGVVSRQNSTDTSGARLIASKSRGTSAAPTIVVTGDTLANWVSEGYDGANYLQMGSIQVVAEGTIAATRVPTRMVFSTATDAAPSVLAEFMRADSAQNVGIGTLAAPTARLDVLGASASAAAARIARNVSTAYTTTTALAGLTLENTNNAGSGFVGVFMLPSSAGSTSGAGFGTARTGTNTQSFVFSNPYTTERMRLNEDGSFILGSQVGTTALATGGFTVYGAASQKGVVIRTNATTPGNGLEVGSSTTTGLFVTASGATTISNGTITIDFTYGNISSVMHAKIGPSTSHGMSLRTNGADLIILNAAGTSATFAEALDFVFGTTTGTRIGTGATQKIGAYGNTAVVRPAAYTQTYATASRTHAARTAGTLTDSSGGTSGGTTVGAIAAASVDTSAASRTSTRDAIATLAAMVNNLITDQQNSAQVLNQMLDDDQLIGWKA